MCWHCHSALTGFIMGDRTFYVSISALFAHSSGLPSLSALEMSSHGPSFVLDTDSKASHKQSDRKHFPAEQVLVSNRFEFVFFFSRAKLNWSHIHHQRIGYRYRLVAILVDLGAALTPRGLCELRWFVFFRQRNSPLSA